MKERMNIPIEIAKKMRELPESSRREVRAVVQRDVNACRRLGIVPENMERVWIEAIEAVQIDDRYAEKLKEKWPEWEPIRKYDVYDSPKAA